MMIGCLCYHKKKITDFDDYLEKRDLKKKERQGIGHIFRKIKMGRTNARFDIQETENEYIIRCARDDFRV